MKELERFGKWLAEQRISRSLTQQALADLIFVSKSKITKAEAGEHAPQRASLAWLAEAWGFSRSSLFSFAEGAASEPATVDPAGVTNIPVAASTRQKIVSVCGQMSVAEWIDAMLNWLGEQEDATQFMLIKSITKAAARDSIPDAAETDGIVGKIEPAPRKRNAAKLIGKRKQRSEGEAPGR